MFQNDKDYRKFIDFLHANSIDKFIDLPEIAVMGDTSSGKSSLLSAISQIQLPSNDQITTRCPLRLRMERSDIMKVTINIKWHISSNYQSESKFQEIVLQNNWDTISTCISETQKHILELSKTEVSRDIVKVNIYGPECIDLTLIDLPGIAHNVAKNENKSLIPDIKSLIDDYLTNERCIILAVVPANVDFHNSQIMADAQKVDLNTSRTIPVITKPDLIDKGAEKSVLELLLGNKMSFSMGFHMVKLRSQKELNDNLKIDEMLELEKRYFNNDDTWKNEPNRELFGIKNLCSKLVKLQIDITKKSIPAILKQINEKKDKTQLKNLVSLAKLIEIVEIISKVLL